jgi:chemotaxis protein CheC
MQALLDEHAESALTLTPLQRSALAEVGNVSGCAFLNSLADAIKMRITPTTPLIVCDMAGAILDAMLADIAQTNDRALVIQTEFTTDGTADFTGHFLLLPDADGLTRVFSALEADCG